MSDARRGLSLLSKYRQPPFAGGCIKIVEQHCAIILHVVRKPHSKPESIVPIALNGFSPPCRPLRQYLRFVVHIANSLMGIAPRCFSAAADSGSGRNRTALMLSVIILLLLWTG